MGPSPMHENLLGDTVSKDLSPLSPNVTGDSFLPARHFGQLQLRHSEKHCQVFWERKMRFHGQDLWLFVFRSEMNT